MLRKCPTVFKSVEWPRTCTTCRTYHVGLASFLAACNTLSTAQHQKGGFAGAGFLWKCLDCNLCLAGRLELCSSRSLAWGAT
jgi:hypothetical protein